MEFDGLRVALLLIGVLIVVGVYFWDRMTRRDKATPKMRREPALHGDPTPPPPRSEEPRYREPSVETGTETAPGEFDIDFRETPIEMETESDEVPVLYDEIFQTPEEGEPSDVIVVNIFSKPGQRFSGDELEGALKATGMEYGAMRIYHRMSDSGDRLFSLVNSVEPGYFEPERYSGFSTPGVSMFLALPGPDRPGTALEELIATAQSLTRRLDGRLLDQDRNPLRPQGIEHLRERVREFERQRRLVSAKR